MFFNFSANHPDQQTIVKLSFNEGVKYNIFVEISQKRRESNKGTYFLICCFYNVLSRALKIEILILLLHQRVQLQHVQPPCLIQQIHC